MKRISYFESFIKEKYNFDERYKPDDLQELVDSLGALEFNTACNWIKKFGGEQLLKDKNIINGYFLLIKLLSGDITIEEIDEVTKGKHGQADDIAFSETNIAKETIIPSLEYIKMKQDSNKYNL